MAILDSKMVVGWGSNEYGLLSLATTTTVYTSPTGPALLLGAADKALGVAPINVTIGYKHACVLFNNYKVKCVGQGTSGALGYNDFGSYGSTASTDYPTYLWENPWARYLQVVTLRARL